MLYKKPLPTAGALAFAGHISGGHFLKWLLVLSLGSSTVKSMASPFPPRSSLWFRDIAFSLGEMEWTG